MSRTATRHDTRCRVFAELRQLKDYTWAATVKSFFLSIALMYAVFWELSVTWGHPGADTNANVFSYLPQATYRLLTNFRINLQVKHSRDVITPAQSHDVTGAEECCDLLFATLDKHQDEPITMDEFLAAAQNLSQTWLPELLNLKPIRY